MNANLLFNFLDVDYKLKILKYAAPIGVSFYTLQAISYLVDVYRGKIEADFNLPRLALYLSFFPSVMEGPISRYNEVAKDLFSGAKIKYFNLCFGIQRILFGLMKKMVIADRLNPIVKNIFTNYQKMDGSVILLGAILYTIQLYMDFSGVMDMAIGTGEIFGVKMPENFKQPFFSKNISEFWSRWHITLGTFFKDYIFYPISLSNFSKKTTKFFRKYLGNYYGPLIPGAVALFAVMAL